jgi:hypothetical protein
MHELIKNCDPVFFNFLQKKLMFVVSVVDTNHAPHISGHGLFLNIFVPIKYLTSYVWFAGRKSYRYSYKVSIISLRFKTKLKLSTHFCNILQHKFNWGHAAGSVVGWDTALQVVRPRVRSPMQSLEFFIDITFPAALWPWGWLRNISWAVKAAGAYGWQPYHLHLPIVLKGGSLNLLEPSGPVQACNGIALLYHKFH